MLRSTKHRGFDALHAWCVMACAQCTLEGRLEPLRCHLSLPLPPHLEMVQTRVVGHPLIEHVFEVHREDLDDRRPRLHEDLVHETRSVHGDKHARPCEQLYLPRTVCTPTPRKGAVYIRASEGGVREGGHSRELQSVGAAWPARGGKMWGKHKGDTGWGEWRT